MALWLILLLGAWGVGMVVDVRRTLVRQTEDIYHRRVRCEDCGYRMERVLKKPGWDGEPIHCRSHMDTPGEKAATFLLAVAYALFWPIRAVGKGVSKAAFPRGINTPSKAEWGAKVAAIKLEAHAATLEKLEKELQRSTQEVLEKQNPPSQELAPVKKNSWMAELDRQLAQKQKALAAYDPGFASRNTVTILDDTGYSFEYEVE